VATARRGSGASRDVLTLGREQALALADRVGAAEVEAMMREAAAELEARIRANVSTGSGTPTSLREMRETLAQVRDVTRTVAKKLGGTTLSVAGDAADAAATSMFDYLQGAQGEFSPGRPLPIREAAMCSRRRRRTRRGSTRTRRRRTWCRSR